MHPVIIVRSGQELARDKMQFFSNRGKRIVKKCAVVSKEMQAMSEAAHRGTNSGSVEVACEDRGPASSRINVEETLWTT